MGWPNLCKGQVVLLCSVVYYHLTDKKSRDKPQRTENERSFREREGEGRGGEGSYEASYRAEYCV